MLEKYPFPAGTSVVIETSKKNPLEHNVYVKGFSSFDEAAKHAWAMKQALKISYLNVNPQK